MHRCTIVVPCYNEADRIDVATFTRFADRHPNIRFVMVNDGSTDDTLVVLSRLEEKNGRAFGVLDLKQNRGKAEAVRRGILQALDDGTDFVGYWDADLATPLEEICVFLDALHEEPTVNVILGSRVQLLGHKIDRHPVRHVLGRVFATAASLVLWLPVYDTQCGAKLFRAGPFVHRIFSQPFRTGWVFDVEMLARLRCIEDEHESAKTPRVREIPLRAWRDVAGSKVRPSAFVRSFFELGLIAWSYRKRTMNAGQRTATLALPLSTRHGDQEQAPKLHRRSA